MPLPRIETARLRLRPLALDDVDDLHRIMTDPDVRRYLWDDRAMTREEAQSVIRDSVGSFATRGFGLWMVIQVGSGALLGFCGLRCAGDPPEVDAPEGDPPEVELLYCLVPSHWGRGLATEAARAALRYGFEENGIERIVAGADAANEASVRVMERAGMTFQKRATSGQRELVYFAITRQQFRNADH
jgi:ribosomal-protein-alanine N-acetyltransferase